MTNTVLAVTRPQIAKAMGVSMTSLNNFFCVADDGEVRPRLRPLENGRGRRTVYLYASVAAFLSRVCSKRFTSAANVALRGVAFEIEVA